MTTSIPADPGPHTPAADLPPPDWVPISSYPSFGQADEHALVLLATGFDCWLHPQEEVFVLSVPVARADQALTEIRAYQADLPLPMPTRDPSAGSKPQHDGAGLMILVCLTLISVFTLQMADPSITEQGLCSTAAILDRGEWWRCFTSLFLHADISHLAGNLLGGSLFGVLLIRAIGPFPATLGTLLCGTLGNFLNAILHHPEDHRSIGASTAVFGALGMLSACGFFELLQHRRSLPWRRIIAPVLAGIILLGWMGGGSVDGNVDVSAHIAGFCCGLVTGSLHQSLRIRTTRDPASYRS